MMLGISNLWAADTPSSDSLRIIEPDPYHYRGEKSCICVKKKHYGLIEYFGKKQYGEVILPPIYDAITEFCDNYIIIKGSLAGLADFDGNLLLPIKFKYILGSTGDDSDQSLSMEDSMSLECTYRLDTKEFKYITNGPFFLKSIKARSYFEDDMTCLSDSNGVSLSDTFNYIAPFKSGKALAQKDSIVGFIDLNGQFTEEAQYRNFHIKPIGNAYKLTKTLSVNKDKEGKTSERTICCLLDSTYNETVPAEYDDLTPYSTFIIAHKGGKVGLISYDNEILVPFNYEDMNIVDSKNVIIAKKNGKYGVITSGNKTIIPFKYNNLFHSNDMYVAQKGNHYGVVTSKRIVVRFKYDDIKSAYSSEGCGGTNYTFREGEASALCWDGRRHLPTNFWEARKKKKQYLLSSKGDIIIKGENVNVLDVNVLERLNNQDFIYYEVRKNKEYVGIYTPEGKCIFPAKYDYISLSYDEDSLYSFPRFKVVDAKGHKGIYSITGKRIVPVRYKKIDDHTIIDDNGTPTRKYYEVMKKGDVSHIYFSNGKHLPFRFTDAEITNDNQFFIVENIFGKVGVYRIDGKRIIPAKYQDIDDHTSKENPCFIVSDKNDKEGAFSLTGKSILPVKYSDVHFDKNNKLIGEE